MSTPHGGLVDEVWNDLIQGLLTKKYQLLLGAGISLEVLDRGGRSLPGGSAMATEIVDEFQLVVSPREETDLGRVFRSAGSRTSHNGETRDEWLKRRFSLTKPPAWYSLLEAVSWKTIWTLNIDDAVEVSMGHKAKAIHFADNITDTRDGIYPVVHLHGYAKRPEAGTVFSIDQYREYTTSPKSWPVRFDEVLSDHPFVILGAALHHEFDLASALSRRSQNTRSFPTIAVLPSPSAMDREDFASWDISIYDGTAEAFLLELRESLVDARAHLAPPNASPSVTTPSLVRFLEQWRPLGNGKRSKWHDYLAGDEPEYTDARSGLVIERSMQNGIEELLEAGHPVLLHGGPFSGKTSVALSVCHKLSQKWRIFEMDNESGPDIDAILTRLREYPDTILYLESAGEFVKAISDLAVRAAVAGIPVRMLAVDRTGPADRLVQLGWFDAVEVPSQLDDQELERMALLLLSKRALKRLPGSTQNAINAKVLRSNSVTTMTSVISSLILGESFEMRVRSDYQLIRNQNLQSFAVLAALGSRVGGGVPIGIAASALGISPRNLELALTADNMANSILRLSGSKVRLRHRLFADLLTERIVANREVYDVAIRLCLAIAPQLSVAAIRNGTWPHRMASHILDHERLSALIGRPNLDSFYNEVQSGFAWSSRFWEQRALAASVDGSHNVAWRFAKDAISIHCDSFSLNTLATVLYRRLWSRAGLAPEKEIEDAFWDAAKVNREAWSHPKNRSEHPYVNFFHNAQRYGEFAAQTQHYLPEELRRLWTECWNEATGSRVFGTAHGGKQLLEYQRKWLQLAASDAMDPQGT